MSKTKISKVKHKGEFPIKVDILISPITITLITSFTSLLIKKGFPLKGVPQLMGSNPIKITEIYLPISNKFKKALKSLLNDF